MYHSRTQDSEVLGPKEALAFVMSWAGELDAEGGPELEYWDEVESEFALKTRSAVNHSGDRE